MRVKLDESLSPLVAEPLTRRGHDVLTVLGQGWGGEPDDAIWPRIVEEEVFFVTGDRGFADVREHPPGTHAGVLVLHAARPSVVLLAAILDSALERMSLDQLVGCVCVADESSLRVRRPLP